MFIKILFYSHEESISWRIFNSQKLSLLGLLSNPCAHCRNSCIYARIIWFSAAKSPRNNTNLLALINQWSTGITLTSWQNKNCVLNINIHICMSLRLISICCTYNLCRLSHIQHKSCDQLCHRIWHSSGDISFDSRSEQRRHVDYHEIQNYFLSRPNQWPNIIHRH